MPIKKPLAVFQFPKWYIDFQKVREKSHEYKKQLVKLQQIVHLPNFKSELLQLVQVDFKVFELIVLMFAVRWDKFKMKKVWHLDAHVVLEQDKWESIFTFLEEVGIIQVLTSGEINNYFDYLFGVEVGLNTHARKNRTGVIMEEAVEVILKQKLEKQKIIWYEKEKKIANVIIKYSLNLPFFSETLQKKVFDFIYQEQSVVYFLECNYYNTSGSKIDATILQYQKLHEEVVKTAVNCEFVWVTDGPYWNNEKVWISTGNKIKNLFLLKEFENKN